MLPRNDIPEYSMKLKSDEKVTIKYRPFLVKEEKIMLMAAQSKEQDEIKGAINQVIKNCVIEPKDFNPDELATFDIEWLLINLRIRSVGSKISNEYTCNNVVVDGMVCGNTFKVDIDLNDVKTQGNPKPDSKIMLGEKFGVLMRPPRFKIMKEIEPEKINDYYDYTILRDSVVSIFDDKQQYQMSEQTSEEAKEWFDSLTKEQYDKLKTYLTTLPSFIIDKEHKCEKCGFIHSIHVDNIESFF